MALLLRSALATRPMWMSMAWTARRNMSSHKKETDEEFDQRWKAYFERKNIDGRSASLSEEENHHSFCLLQVGIFVKELIT